MEENRIPKRVLYMNLETTRLRGRPRNKWRDEVRENGWNVGGEGWQKKIYNREEWKNLLRTARNRHILHMPMEWINEWNPFHIYLLHSMHCLSQNPHLVWLLHHYFLATPSLKQYCIIYHKLQYVKCHKNNFGYPCPNNTVPMLIRILFSRSTFEQWFNYICNNSW
jgi:hypothetical protein